MERSKKEDEKEFGKPAYSVLDDAGFGFSDELLRAAETEGDADAPDDVQANKERWMGVQQGDRQTGTGVAPGQGDAEAGAPSRPTKGEE